MTAGRVVDVRCTDGHVTQVVAHTEHGRVYLAPDYCHARVGASERCLRNVEIIGDHDPDPSDHEDRDR